MTNTDDAFLHIALQARERLVVMIPFIDKTGAVWAADLFQSTSATSRILILRDRQQLHDCGNAATPLLERATAIYDYNFPAADLSGRDETFHAKIVLADGVSAYVGSANLLWRSKESNLECGMLIEGPAVRSVSVLLDAVIEALQT